MVSREGGGGGEPNGGRIGRSGVRSGTSWDFPVLNWVEQAGEKHEGKKAKAVKVNQALMEVLAHYRWLDAQDREVISSLFSHF
jgi:hypothetical protein